MTNYSRQAILLGLIITLAALIAQWCGWFEPMERESLDFRAAYTWLTPQPMSDQICIVAIDDSALESVGRWPWPRSKLAGAIRELRRAGAKTIALDLLLTEPETDPEEPKWEEVGPAEIALRELRPEQLKCEGEGEKRECFVLVDHDRVLAEELRSVEAERGRCVLAIFPPDDLQLGDAWLSDAGGRHFQRLLQALGQNTQLTVEEAAARAELSAEQTERFRRRELMIKSMAASQALDQMSLGAGASGGLTLDQFLRKMTPQRSEIVGNFPEKRLLEQTWTRYDSWQRVRRLLIPGGGSSLSRDQPPIPILAEQAAAIGFVSSQADPDAEIREQAPILAVPGGQAPQFGLAAAMVHLALRPTDLGMESNRLTVGAGTTLPLRNGKIWLYWPRPLVPRASSEGIFRRTMQQSESHGFISLAVAVSLSEQRERHEINKRDFAMITYAYAPDSRPETPLLNTPTDAMIKEAGDNIRSMLGDFRPEELDELSEEERKDIAPALRWLAHQKMIPEGKAVLEKAEQKLRDAVQGKLAFIGSTATGAADFASTPLDAATPGVIVHAVVADMVLSGHSIRFAPGWTTFGLIAMLGLTSTLAAGRLEPARSTATAAMVLLTYFILVSYVAFGWRGIALAMVGPMVTGGAAWIGCTALEAYLFQRDRLRITRQFKARVSSQLVDYLVENPGAVSMSGEQREMTIMFSDLAGFTSLSESLGGPATVATLNRYLGAMTEVLIKEGAYLNKFLGDGFVAFWSAFAIDPKQSTRACRAALHCQRAVRELNEKPIHENLPRLSLRVGITTGRVIVGDCGAPPQLNDYTVIGDAVNLASRLESANKQFGTRVLIDGRTRELLDADDLVLRPIGRVRVVGQKNAVDVYEVLPADFSGEVIDLTAKAVDAFKSGDLAESAATWKKLVDRTGPSLLAATYLEAIAEIGSDFDGVLHLREK